MIYMKRGTEKDESFGLRHQLPSGVVSEIPEGHLRAGGVMNVKHYSRSRCLNQKCYRRIGALSRPIGVISAGKSDALNPP